MNVLTELWLGYDLSEHSATRGFTGDQIAAAAGRLDERGWVARNRLTPRGRAAREQIEAATDAAQAGVLSRLFRPAHEIVADTQVVADAVLAACAAPADPRKRAAG